MKNALIFVGVGAATLLFLRYSRSAFAISSSLRYPGKVANVTGEARQVFGDIKSITADGKSIIDNIKGIWDTTNDADNADSGGWGSMFGDVEAA
jgi:hypothetical protein